jgi:DNA-binding CsgD family transcriptional regulator/PAS domain-containing protein
MPSIRIPRAFYASLKERGADVTVSLPEASASVPPPHVMADDPRFHAFAQVSFDVLYDWNIETGSIYYTEQIDYMLGMVPGGFPRSLQGWLEHVHEADHDAACDALWESVTTGKSLYSEYRLRAADGGYVTVNDHGVVLTDRHGRATNMIGALRDISREREALAARREAEDLQRVFLRIANPTWRVNAQGVYLDANEKALEFLERSLEETVGRSVRNDFPAEVHELISAPLRIGDTGVELEVGYTVGPHTKTLMLTIIPSRMQDERSYFLLGTDITAQKALQQELARSEHALRRQTTILNDSNAALRVILQQREQDRVELEERIQANMEQLIEPTLDRLSRLLRHRPERLELEALRHTLREIVVPFAQRLTKERPPGGPLTRREVEVANLVRLGKTSDEIAETLHISRSAVSFHRANIRRKYGLTRDAARLSTHLTAMTQELD